MSDLRPRRMLSVLCALFAIGVVLVHFVGCGAFVGPATTPDATYTFKCDDGQVCLTGKEYCSSTKPRRCITDWARMGIASDAGRE